MTRRESRSGGARAPGGKGERLDEPVSRDYGLEGAFKEKRGKGLDQVPSLKLRLLRFRSRKEFI